MVFSAYSPRNCAEAVKELRTVSFYVDCVVDGVGTLLLVFYCVFIGLTFDPADGATRIASGALIGAVVYGTLETFGHIQWAAINPIVAAAFALTGKISILKGVAYIIFELIGGIGGAYIAWSVAREVDHDQFAKPALAQHVTWSQGYVVTGMITMSLILSIIASLDDVNRKPTVPALTVGVTTAYGIIIAAPHSAGISNPAVGFSIAFITNHWEYQGMFWAGGFSGTIVAVMLYTLFTKFGGKQAKEYARRNEVDKDVVISAKKTEPSGYDNQGMTGVYSVHSESFSSAM